MEEGNDSINKRATGGCSSGAKRVSNIEIPYLKLNLIFSDNSLNPRTV
jgi:hypothetical protein